MTEIESDGKGAVGELIRVREQVDDGHPGGPAAFFDELFAALAHRRRRSLLTQLQVHGELDLDSLAGRIAADERAETVGAVPDEAITRVHVSLFHQHLPKLDDVGLVDFDPDADRVSLSETGERLELSLNPDSPMVERE